jgi:hypothetical protein
MAITGNDGEVLLRGKPAVAKAIPSINQSKGNIVEQNDGQNAGQENQGLPSQDNQSRGFHDIGADAVGLDQSAFFRPRGFHPTMEEPHPHKPGMGFGRRQSFTMGEPPYAAFQHTTIDLEEHIWEVAAFEETFANYMTEFPPVYVEKEERDIVTQKAIRHSYAMVRNLRELVIAQLTEHLGSRQYGRDPFFSQHRIPRLLPIPAHEAAEKKLETIPFGHYFQRLNMCFPNFAAPVFMHMLAAFGDLLQVGTSTVEGAPREHFLILPDAHQVVEHVSKLIAQQPAACHSQSPQRRY